MTVRRPTACRRRLQRIAGFLLAGRALADVLAGRVLAGFLLAGMFAALPGEAAPAPSTTVTINALIEAARDADGKRLEAMLRQGAPVNQRSTRRERPLQAAAAEGRSANVFALLTRGADIDALGSRGTTALGWAARNGHEPTVRMLLDSGANPDTADQAIHAPVVLAAAHDHKSILLLLIERGSKVFESQDLAGAMLGALAESRNMSIAGAVVPRLSGLVADSAALRALAADAIVNADAIVSQTIRKNLGATAQTRDFQTALLLAAVRRARPDVATAAIEAGADVNASHPRFGSPLSVAMEREDRGMVGMLLGANVDWKAAGVDEARLRALSGADAEDSRKETLADSSGQRDALDERGETLLFRAARRGDFLSVKRLLTKGHHPATTVKRWPGDAGWTSLMIAAAGGQHAIVDLLLRAGAPVDQRNAAGRTALLFAAFYARASVVSLLLAAGADPDLADELGQTPIMLAEASGDIATQQALRMASRGNGWAAPATAGAARVPGAVPAARSGQPKPGAARRPGRAPVAP
ncbi:MAG: ankyrin repeat domain-containing protein [Candidatus Binatia bacterium]